MIVRITRAKVGHCQTPIYDTRLTAGVILCGVEGREGMKRKQSAGEPEKGMSGEDRKEKRLAECTILLASCALDGNYLICV